MDQHDYYEENLAEIEAFLANAFSATACNMLLGFELEHIIVDVEARHAVSYEGEDGRPGIRAILQELQPFYTECTNGEALIGLSRKDEQGRETTLTLEPGAQLEISTGPFTCVSEIETSYAQFRAELDPILARHGYEAACVGYQPFDRACDIPLIPKKRYQFMDKYFTTTGDHGVDMMRGSASTQISIDYCSEEDWVAKLRVATVLGPLLSLLTDNAPYFDANIDPSRMLRTRIWDSVDDDRSLVIPGLFNSTYGFKDYANYLLNSPIILASREGKDYFTHTTPARDIYAGHRLTKEDIAHLFSMFFFDVRTKNYIEIRVADSMPIEFALGYAALIKGLFYYRKNLEHFIEFTSDLQTRTNGDVEGAIVQAKRELIDRGYDATVYGYQADKLILDLLRRAQQGLSEKEQGYLEPLMKLAEQRTTLADKVRHGARSVSE